MKGKPEPFGTEFKAILCATTCVRPFVETQKGKLVRWWINVKITPTKTMVPQGMGTGRKEEMCDVREENHMNPQDLE